MSIISFRMHLFSVSPPYQSIDHGHLSCPDIAIFPSFSFRLNFVLGVSLLSGVLLQLLTPSRNQELYVHSSAQCSACPRSSLSLWMSHRHMLVTSTVLCPTIPRSSIMAKRIQLCTCYVHQRLRAHRSNLCVHAIMMLRPASAQPWRSMLLLAGNIQLYVSAATTLTSR